MLVVDNYDIILAIVVDRNTWKLTNEIRQYGEFDELSISLEKVGPLAVEVSLNADDLELWR